MLLYPPDLLKCHLFPWKSARIKLLDLITFSPTVVTRTQNTCTCIHVLLHILYTLNWLSLFWLAKSVHWIFEIFISTGDVIYCSCRLYNNHVKDTQGHGKSCHAWPSSAWFLRVIMSNSRALCCLPSFKKQKRDFHFFHSMYNYVGSVFVIFKIIKALLMVLSLSLQLWLITPTSTLMLVVLDIINRASDILRGHGAANFK